MTNPDAMMYEGLITLMDGKFHTDNDGQITPW